LSPAAPLYLTYRISVLEELLTYLGEVHGERNGL
jgi:hypothetical protein